MIESSEEDIFIAKYARLTNIASIANVLVWIVFIIYAFYAIATAISDFTSFIGRTGQNYSFTELINSYPLEVTRFIMRALSTFVHGAVLAVVLKGISYGLNMIVETHLNYRGRMEGEANE